MYWKNEKNKHNLGNKLPAKDSQKDHDDGIATKKTHSCSIYITKGNEMNFMQKKDDNDSGKRDLMTNKKEMKHRIAQVRKFIPLCIGFFFLCATRKWEKHEKEIWREMKISSWLQVMTRGRAMYLLIKFIKKPAGNSGGIQRAFVITRFSIVTINCFFKLNKTKSSANDLLHWIVEILYRKKKESASVGLNEFRVESS